MIVIWTPQLWLPRLNPRRFNLPRYRRGALKKQNPGCGCCGCNCTGDCGAGEVCCGNYTITADAAEPCGASVVQVSNTVSGGVCCWLSATGIRPFERWYFSFLHNGTDLEARVMKVLVRAVGLQNHILGAWKKVVASCNVGSGLQFTEADYFTLDHNAHPNCSITSSGDDFYLPCSPVISTYVNNGSACVAECNVPITIDVTCGS